MDISVTARHCEIGAGLRARVQVRVDRLARCDSRLRGVDVVFDGESGQHVVEVRAAADARPLLVGMATADSFRVALDRAMDKVDRQARRARGRRRARRGPAVAVAP